MLRHILFEHIYFTAIIYCLKENNNLALLKIKAGGAANTYSWS